MEKRIELELRGKTAGEVKELNLDNCRAPQLEGLTDEFKELEMLSLINVGLTSLKGFPSLPNLKRLELSDNRLTGGLEHLSGCPGITHVNLSGNKIQSIDTLEPLKQLKKLKSLDLFNCEVTTKEDYRDKVFELIPHLKYLDGFDKDENDCEEDSVDFNDADEDEEDDEEVEHDDDDEGADEDEENEDDDEENGDDEDGEEEASSGANNRGKKRKHEDETSQ
uniref:U2A'/phosphoprotein 32 family A C-terminal domain-containing protein n=1 Tax=Romanomermis culicivorax TaxID=13658 RepID=A0A915K9B2_ROMCU